VGVVFPDVDRPDRLTQFTGNLDQITDITNNIGQINKDFGDTLETFSKNADQTIQNSIRDANASLSQFGDDAYKKADHKINQLIAWLEEK
jgi:hypothetical protein